jgi:hypothetical protein
VSLEPPAPPVAFSEPEPPKPPQWRGAFASLGIGLGAALLGLLPWLLTGMRLPTQALWAFEALPEQMPIAFLPLGNSTVTELLGMLVVGWVAAGVAARALAARLPSRAPVSIAAGLLLVQVVALAQSVQAMQRGLPTDDGAGFYLTACVAVAVVGVAIGLIAFVLVARAPRGGAVLGLVAGSLALAWWFGAFFAPRGVLPIELYSGFQSVLRWVPAVLVGASIAWAGVRTPGRIVAAVVSLLALWIVPALGTAVSAAAGSRMLLHFPAEALDYAVNVLQAAAFMPSLVVPPLVVAVVVAAAGIGGREVLARRARQA